MSTKDYRSSFLIPAILLSAMLLVPPLLGAAPAWAQSATGASAAPAVSSTPATAATGQSAQKATVPLHKAEPPATLAGQEAEKYSSEGWSVVGPVQITSANANEIKYQVAKQDQTVSVAGKSLTVVNPDTGTTAAIGSLQPNTWVYICQLEANAVVILSPQTAKMREQRNDQ